MSDWKPGDVARFPGTGRPWLRTETGWTYSDGSVGGPPQDAYTSARRLVVIDPEDAEQVERLMTIIDEWAGRVPYDRMRKPGDLTGEVALAAALREFAAPTPPKPDEPQGLGAVVEDARGWTYVSPVPGTYWYCVDDDNGDRKWADIDVARVLSEGVTLTTTTKEQQT